MSANAVRTLWLPVNAESIAKAARVLEAGGLVAFPTETVYGLGARADDSRAVKRIFEAKGRPLGNPLIVHVRGIAEARALCRSWPEEARRLAEAFWPGPLTLVVACRQEVIAPEVRAGQDTVALRMPAHPAARALLDACAFPIAAPSANRSASISPTSAEHVLKSLSGRIDMVLDGGRTGYGIESAIVDVTRSPVVLLRQGALTQMDLARVVDVVDCSSHAVKEDESRAAPGLMDRHYAPEAITIVLPSNQIKFEVERRIAQNERIGVVAYSDAFRFHWPDVRVEMLPGRADAYAAELYAALHRLDDAHCDSIVIEAVPDGLEWAAVRDRLRRAGAPKPEP